MASGEYERIDDKERFLDFLKRFNVYKEVQALHSRSRAVVMMNDVRNDEEPTTVLTKAMKNWLVPVDLIRSYYGDQVAVYFEFMNFFLRWMAIPGFFGSLVSILNKIFYNEDRTNSPLSALFSIGMSIWAAAFSIHW